jgi:hypothetical protein
MAILLQGNEIIDDEFCIEARRIWQTHVRITDTLRGLLPFVASCYVTGLGGGTPFELQTAAKILDTVVELPIEKESQELQELQRRNALLSLLMFHEQEAFPATYDPAAARKLLSDLESSYPGIKKETGWRGRGIGVVPMDTRVRLDLRKEENAGFRGIGIVGILGIVGGGLPAGTGFLIDSCHVITNKHVAFGLSRELEKDYPDKTFRYVFYLGADGSNVRRPKEVIRAKVIWHGGKTGIFSFGSKDIALLRLETNASSSYRPVRVLWRYDDLDGIENDGFLIGFPALPDFKRHEGRWPWKTSNCAQFEHELSTLDLWGFSCIATPGNSGGPFFLIGRDRQPIVLGVVTTGNVSHSELDERLGDAGVLPLFRFRDEISRVVGADPC